jgi:arylsulfatase A-like enzyme
VADLAGATTPPGLDGYSILPTLVGRGQQAQRESLYFEIYEPDVQQAVRMGDWKRYRLGTKAPLELYNVKTDPVEKQNVAAARPDVVRQIEALMRAEHRPPPHYDASEQGSPRASSLNVRCRRQPNQIHPGFGTNRFRRRRVA